MLQSLQQELAKLLPNDPGVFIWPVDRSGYFRISSEFGQRWHPILRTNRFHSGLDIAKPKGANVYAVAPGRVVYAGWRGGYGYTVIIAHTATRSTLYGHLSQILVSVGQDVKRGQVIAKVGSTGLSTGPHLHFEVRENGTPVNPRQFLP